MRHAPIACAYCDDELEHCHGTLVLHLDGEAVCTEADCSVDPAGHLWMGSCWDMVEACACGTPTAPGTRWAA